MAGMVIEKLVAELGFNIDDKNLNRFQKNIDNTKKALQRFSLVASIAIGTVGKAFLTTAGKARDLDRLSARADVSTENFQKLAAAFEAAGVPGQQLASALESIANKARDVQIGDQGAIRGFSRLGIQLRNTNGELKQSDQLLVDIAESLRRLPSDSLRRVALSDLGIDIELGKELEKGAENIRQLLLLTRDAPFIFSERQKQQLEEANRQFSLFKQSISGLKDEFTVGLAPAFNDTLESLNAMIKGFRDFFREDPQAVFDGIKVALAGLSFLVPGGAIVRGMTILVSLARDFNKAFEDSFILGFFESLNNVLEKTLGLFGQGIGAVAEGLGVEEQTVSALARTPGAAFDTVKNAAIGLSDISATVAKSVVEAIRGGSDSDLSAGTTENNTTNNFTINIDGAGNPQETAQEVLTAIDARIAADNLTAGVV